MSPRALLLVLCASCAAGACGTPRRGEPVAGPLPRTDPSVARGELVFAQACHKCHPGGEAGLGPSLNDKPIPDFLKRFQVRHGLGAMPGFPEDALPDAELDDLIVFLDELRGHGPR